MKVTRNWLLQSARSEAEKYFDTAKLLCLIPRETVWYAITLLESGDQNDLALANRIFETIHVTDGTHSPCTLFVILKRYEHLLSEFAAANIRANLEANLPISATVRYSDGNVNHPMAAYVNLVCAGELFQDKSSIALGKNLLNNFQQTISSRRHKHFRQSEMAEYNSPTYTALTLWFLALAAEFVSDEEFKSLALFLEEQLWINVAKHWHAPTQQFVGPFSRAYAEDSLGGFSALHCTFGFASQRDIFLEPHLPVKFNHPSALIENAFVATLNFHIPQQALDIAFDKPLPYSFKETTYCEQYHENTGPVLQGESGNTFDPDVYPGGWGDLSSFLSDEFCLGTSSRPYVNGGQHDAFSLHYRRAETIAGLSDFRGAFTRMVFNGSRFGQDNFCHTCKFKVTKDYLYEEGRPFIFQHQNAAIVGYVPKRAGHLQVNEIRLDLIFSHHAPFDFLAVDDEEIKSLPIEKKNCAKILIQDYQTRLAIFPLKSTPLYDFPGKIKIEQRDNFLFISFYNYEGETRDFTKEQLSQCLNGIACVLDSKKHNSTFQDFRGSVHLSQEIQSPFIHKIDFERGKNKMTFRFDPVSERIVERTLNGIDQTFFYADYDIPRIGEEKFYPKNPYVLPKT